jgi:hypothetical protein
VQGLITGSIYWQLPTTAYVQRFSLFYTMASMSFFAHLVEIGFLFSYKATAEKHVTAGILSPFAYSLSLLLAQLPFTVCVMSWYYV